MARRIYEDHGDGTIYRGKVVITEGAKELNLIIGKKELLLYAGQFLTFYENDDFRFAYPIYPECTDISGGNAIVLISPPWLGFDRIITVTHEPVDKIPDAQMDTGSIINLISSQHSTVASMESATVNGIPSVSYCFEPPDGYPTAGIAFFHNDMLICFEVSIAAVNVQGLDGIGYAKALLGELLPTLTMK